MGIRSRNHTDSGAHMRKFLARKEEGGATAIEYALIAALIGIIIIGGLTAAGLSVSATFNTVTAALPLTSTSGGGVAGGGASAGGAFGSGGSAGSGIGGAMFGP